MWKNDIKNYGKLQAATDRPIDSRQASEATSTIGLEELRMNQKIGFTRTLVLRNENHSTAVD